MQRLSVFLQIKDYGVQILTLTLDLWMSMHTLVTPGLLEIAFTF